MASNNIYGRTSPYFLTEVVNDKYLGLMENRSIPKFASDVLYSIEKVYEYRPDMLAYDLYKNSRLWWVFAQRNPNVLKDPYFDFITGAKIYIPKIETLKGALQI